jgi:phosphate transport system substrate-binding protein
MALMGRFVILMALVLSLTGVACAEGVLRYAGATTLQRFFMPEVARIFTGETGIRVQIEGGNTNPGIDALLHDEIDIAGAGRHLTDAEKNKGLVELFLGWDVLSIIVHERNPVESLSPSQLQGIFSGEIGNWKDVGGDDVPVVVITCPQGSGMRSAVQDLILKDKTFPEREIVSAIVAESDQQVSLFPGGITALSRSMLDADHVKAIKVDGVLPTAANISKGFYPLAKPLALITKGPPQGNLARFMALVESKQGKTILGHSFVPSE